MNSFSITDQLNLFFKDHSFIELLDSSLFILKKCTYKYSLFGSFEACLYMLEEVILLDERTDLSEGLPKGSLTLIELDECLVRPMLLCREIV